MSGSHLVPIRKYITEHEWVKVAGYMLAGVIVLVVVHAIAVQPYTRRLAAFRKDLEQLRAKTQQYHAFADFKVRLNQENGLVNELFSSVNTKLFTKVQTEKDFLDQVGNFCQQANVKLDRIIPTNIDSGQAWSVSFTASFPQMNSFLSSLEKYFRIDSLHIQRGFVGQQGHRVEMTIAPLAVSVRDGEGIMGAVKEKPDIFALLDMVDEVAKKVQQKQAEMGTDGQVALDPFTGESLSKRPEAPKPRAAPVVETPRVSIDGIFWDPETPVVVIEGRALREGEMIKDAKIVKIKEDSVTLEWRGRTFTLKAGRKGE